jgi:hypothetical protein
MLFILGNDNETIGEFSKSRKRRKTSQNHVRKYARTGESSIS